MLRVANMNWTTSAILSFALVWAAFGAAAQSSSTALEGERSAILSGRKPLAWSMKTPIRKQWHELTDEEKKPFLEEYESMPEGDQPPYPKKGLAPVMRELVAAQRELLVEGDLFLVVDVDSNGVAQGVTAYGAPSKEMVQAAGRVLMLTEFKPAVCGGKNCRMQFPFRMTFAVK